MAARLTATGEYVLDSENDVISLPTTTDVAVGTKARLSRPSEPTKTYVWTGVLWREEYVPPEDPDAVQRELLLEMRAVRTGLEMILFLQFKAVVDLREETLKDS